MKVPYILREWMGLLLSLDQIEGIADVESVQLAGTLDAFLVLQAFCDTEPTLCVDVDFRCFRLQVELHRLSVILAKGRYEMP